VLGDKQYGGADEAGGRKFTRQVLHCASLKFTHPATSKPITLNAPLPDDIKEIFDCIKIK
jgi:23S rRNA pseudouridine1911/1915/1917 synthase